MPNEGVLVELRAGLFQVGDFTLASGEKSNWKIECDALTDADWAGLAVMLMEQVGPFSLVLGVPRGGLPLATALRPHTADDGPVLVVDDVWTTGGSMRRFIGENVHRHAGQNIIRAVVFARNPTPSDVTALFTMAPLLTECDHLYWTSMPDGTTWCRRCGVETTEMEAAGG